MTRAFPATAGATVVGAAACSWYAATGAGLGGPRVAGLLAAHHAVTYAVALWWVMLAPVPLLLAAVGARWTSWPWVAVTTLHLATLAAVAVRLRHLVPDIAWLGLAGVGLVAVASVVASFES